MQSSHLVEAEHEIHVLHCLSDGSLQKVVNAAHHEQLVFVLLHIDKRLVGVHDLLHIGAYGDVVCEGRVLVIVSINVLHVFKRQVALRVCRHEDTTREAASLGNEEHTAFVTWAKLLHCLVNLKQMLMRECFIDGDVVVAPGF